MELIRGQKLKLADVAASGVFEVSLDIQSNLVVDMSCFGLDEARKLSDDRYFIFYNQKASPCSSIVLQKSSAGKEVFKLNLSTLPSSVKNIVFVATIDQEGAMSAIGPSALRLAVNGEERLIFPFSGRDFTSEKAVMVAELYFKDQWRFSAVGQGFNGGLSALLKHFGGEEMTPPPTSKVNLGKVTLEKRGAAQKVNLAKHSAPVHINLQWNALQQEKGFFRKTPSDVDLDLGCMYRLKNGNMGVIQPLGGNFGSRDGPPYIYLDKDDRSGAAADGENMYVFHPEEIELMVIFALIYEGTAEFTAVSGRVTIEHEGNFEILAPLNNPEGGKRFCAVARIEPDGDSIRITKDELYFPGHRECDRHYGFGFQWRPGRK